MAHDAALGWAHRYPHRRLNQRESEMWRTAVPCTVELHSTSSPANDDLPNLPTPLGRGGLQPAEAALNRRRLASAPGTSPLTLQYLARPSPKLPVRPRRHLLRLARSLPADLTQ